MKRSKLIIISHTQHYSNEEGHIVGWGPTINEINFLADSWEHIIHIACYYPVEAPESALPYTKSNVVFVPIPPYGGKTVLEKINIIFKIPEIIKEINKNLKDATAVQLRLPTSIGLFLLPYFTFVLTRNYIFWVKYAGDWNRKNKPLSSYTLQKWWLKNNLAKCNVTINGFWYDQPRHCHSFENPCLDQSHLEAGLKSLETKTFQYPFTLVFVGRLGVAKGVDTIINALKQIDSKFIKKVHFIGDGSNKALFQNQCNFLADKVTFHGFMSSNSVHAILKECDFLLLPSQSEGFPKVIAEAACYGVIPIVSNVGSITHYINETNGFVWAINGTHSYTSVLNAAVKIPAVALVSKSKNVTIVAKKFTFESYMTKLEKLVFKNT